MANDPLDKHCVAHDAFTLAFAVICGALGGLVNSSLVMGALMAGPIAVLGVLGMRVGPFRRGINRLAATVAGIGR